MIVFICWVPIIVGEFVIAYLSLRKCRKTYPWFTTLVCFMALKSVALFYIRAALPGETYFYAYYRSEFLADFLQLAASVEVFGTLFRPFWTIPKNSLVTLILCTSFTLAIVARLNVRLSEGGEIQFYRTMDRAVSFSLAITLSAALLFARHFEMPFRSRLRGIATGLYVMSITSVVMTVILSKSGLVLSNSLAIIPVVAHYSTLTIWIYYVEREEDLRLVVGRKELNGLRDLLDQFSLALSNTPTSCGLTQRKAMGKARGEIKAKMVKNNG